MARTLLHALPAALLACGGLPGPGPGDEGAEAAQAPPRLVVQLGHTESLEAVAIAPDGATVLTGSQDGTARLWHAETGRELRAFGGGGEAVRAIAFAHDGGMLATAGDAGVVTLWSATTGARLRRIQAHPQRPTRIAFSRDGGRLLTAGWDGTAALHDAATGDLLVRFTGHTDVVADAALSPDGAQVLTGSHDRTARLWDASSGQELWRIDARDRVTAVAFSPDGEQILVADADQLWIHHLALRGAISATPAGYSGVREVLWSEDGPILLANADGTLWRWNWLFGGREQLAPGLSTGLLVTAFSRDGRRVVQGFGAGVAHSDAWLRDLETGEELQRFVGRAGEAVRAVFSPDERHLLTLVGGRTAVLWSLDSGRELWRYGGSGREDLVRSAIFSRNGRSLLLGIGNSRSALLSVESGEILQRMAGFAFVEGTTPFSRDASRVLTRDGYSPRLWSTRTGEALRTVAAGQRIQQVAATRDGETLLTLDEDGAGVLWSLEDGRELARFATDRAFLNVASAAVSDDRYLALTGHWTGWARLWSLESGEELGRFEGHEDVVTSVAFSADGRYALSSSRDGLVALWSVADRAVVARFPGALSLANSWLDPGTPAEPFSPDGSAVLVREDAEAVIRSADTGEVVRRLRGHEAPLTSVAWAPDGRHVATGGADGTVRVWRADSGEELARLTSFGDGTWVVVDRHGRFDTNNLDRIEGLHWVLPDDPMTPVPIEIFLREFYEPRLLARVLAGALPPPTRRLSDLLRVQPRVAIAGVESDPAHPERVTVTLDVASVRGSELAGADATESGVFDLRLFRDGQLVAWAPSEGGALPLDPETHSARITFPDVRLPRDGRPQVELSAYAFNRDRIKSATVRVRHATGRLPRRRGRAYVLAFGVNAYENPDWNLAFAVNDARLLTQTLGDRLAEGDAFEEVVAVELLSEAEEPGAPRPPPTATKRHMRALLGRLAGDAADPALLAAVPAAERLRPAEPEDLVVLSFSSHGTIGAGGDFHLFPYDIGPGAGREVTPDLMRRTISTDELSVWLRGVDAGELVMIVDACHAAATIEREGFKPGPMGSRGLGQLAYDKGMRVLAASQADSAALESALVRQGLLTHALVRDGLEAGRADFRPQDRRITLDEWLRYGTRRVPELYAEVRRGRIRSFGRGLQVTISGRDDLERSFQQPALFDFARAARPVVLSLGD